MARRWQERDGRLRCRRAGSNAVLGDSAAPWRSRGDGHSRSKAGFTARSMASCSPFRCPPASMSRPCPGPEPSASRIPTGKANPGDQRPPVAYLMARQIQADARRNRKSGTRASRQLGAIAPTANQPSIRNLTHILCPKSQSAAEPQTVDSDATDQNIRSIERQH